MSPGVYIFTIALLPVTAVIVFAMKYASSHAAASARAASDGRLDAVLARHAEELARLSAKLTLIADEQARQSQTLTKIDTVLREVE